MELMKEVKRDGDGIRKGHKQCKRSEAASTARCHFTAERHFCIPVVATGIATGRRSKKRNDGRRPVAIPVATDGDSAGDRTLEINSFSKRFFFSGRRPIAIPVATDGDSIRESLFFQTRCVSLFLGHRPVAIPVATNGNSTGDLIAENRLKIYFLIRKLKELLEGTTVEEGDKVENPENPLLFLKKFWTFHLVKKKKKWKIIALEKVLGKEDVLLQIIILSQDLCTSTVLQDQW
ncbi:hypothetical protein LR48_Vigan08g011000 [Vigna angularis]|uniref:Uncharacterized protein n=1 Tax=Phaseolus angularis TaxID=3914 RepID=A0A0L9V2K7_PHAAN|nr:hypothetical protein LR48_Vigan08g011000 [Vigna angularis]